MAAFADCRSSAGGESVAATQQVSRTVAARSAVAQELGVEPERGLSAEEARRRLQSQSGPEVGATMPLTALSLSHLVVGLALLAVIAVTPIGLLQRIFGTVELSFSQWSICIGIAASLVVVEELIKLVLRQRDRRRVAVQTTPASART
jgi:hypothetical protein